MYNYYQNRWAIQTDDYLMHHGTKGQKWGIRKYQNEDGTLTAEGRQRYGIGDKLRRVKDYLTTTDENGKMHLSKQGKRIAVGAGVGAAAIGAGVGVAALAKAGAFEGLGGAVKKYKEVTSKMTNQELGDYMNKNLSNSIRAVTGRTAEGAKIAGLGPSGAQKAKAAVRGTARHLVASKEYGERKVGDVMRNLASITTKTADQMASGAIQKDVNEIVHNRLKSYASNMLAIGAVASVGLTAYNAKQKVNQEDPTGEKGRYMYPNPNKKK